MHKSISFVGVDAHARFLSVARLPEHGGEPEVVDLPNTPKAIRRAFSKWRQVAELRVCYEAGPVGYELYRQLDAMGIPCEVIAPALIPTRPGDRIKTDRRDAKKLARFYRAGELTPIHVPTPDDEAVRDLVRAREDVRRDLIAARHRLGKFMIRHGRIWSEGSRWTLRHVAWLRRQRFERTAERITFEHYMLQVEHLANRRAALEEEILAVAHSEPYRGLVGRLVCYRGIREVSAMVLLAELYDFHRFAKAEELMSFVGLVPSEHSSAGRVQRGGITKTGNAHVRRILVEAAWAYRHKPSVGPRLKRAFAGQPPHVVAHAKKAQVRLHRRYATLVGKGKRAQVAVTAVARELAGFLWAGATDPIA